MKHYLYSLFALSLAILLTGCASVSPTYVNDGNAMDAQVDKSEPLNPVHFKFGEHFKTSPPKCIAILPFKNMIDTTRLSSEEEKATEAELTVKRLEQLQWNLYSHLAPYSFRDVEIEKVNKAVATLGSDKSNFAEIGSELKCDALLVTELTDYEMGHFGLFSQAAIGVRMQLIRAKDNEVLWQGNHVAKSQGGGVPFTPIGLVEAIYDATINLSDAQQVHVEDDLFRRLCLALDVKSQDLPLDAPKQAGDQIQIAVEDAYPFRIAVSKLYLRTGPGIGFSPKAVLEQDEQLAMVDKEHLPWVQIKMSDGRWGYVNSKYITEH